MIQPNEYVTISDCRRKCSTYRWLIGSIIALLAVASILAIWIFDRSMNTNVNVETLTIQQVKYERDMEYIKASLSEIKADLKSHERNHRSALNSTQTASQI